MAIARQWFGARRLVLKALYSGARARDRVRKTLSPKPATLSLGAVHRRLELVLSAAYGRSIVIAEQPEPSWMQRRLRGWLPFLFAEAPPSLDGETIKLPPRIATHGDERIAADRYRLFAMEQAERIARGTLASAANTDLLERDLYLLREAAAIDASLARSYPGMRAAMEAERTSALSRRPKLRRLTAAERSVEQMLVKTLMTPVAELDSESTPSDPAASHEWARQTAREIRRDHGGKYRGVPLAPVWGAVPPVTGEQLPAYNPALLPTPKPSNAPHSADNPDSGSAGESPEENSGESDVQPNQDGAPDETDDSSEHDEERPSEQAADNDDGGSSSPQASENSSGANVLAGLVFDGNSTDDLPPAIYYDEWDSDRGAYVKSRAAVRLYQPKTGNPSWLQEELQSHAATARQIRRQFERLRARRTLSLRQPRGDMLDLAACVEAMTARRRGDAPDDRLYIDARPARRGIAISLLVDASGSTDTRVTESWRIIDLEKIALLLATRALDALGDLYAIYTFAGREVSNVKVTVVKDFSEKNGDAITRRIAAIEPDGFTRLGAAVRHATRELTRQSAGHRLLLLLSDGRPNDIDAYQGSYGVEDSRQAILEARASGVFPYCLTIDGTASEYLPRIFGRAGHTILQHPEQLPRALLAVVRTLIKQ